MWVVMGVILISACFSLLWFTLPNRQLNRLATMPVMETVIPLGIIGGIAVGLGLIVATFIG
jgi:hypothetical protein